MILHKIPIGKIASRKIAFEIAAIKGALDIFHSKALQNSSSGIIIFSYSKSVLQAIQKGNSHLTQEDIIGLMNRIIAVQRNSTLQWIPAHVDIFGNEQADRPRKPLNSDQLSNSLTFTDADAITSRRLTSQQVEKNFIPDLNYNRIISSTIVRLRTKHRKGMKISPDGQLSYNSYPHSPDFQLFPDHIFNYPATLSQTPQNRVSPPRPTASSFYEGCRRRQSFFRYFWIHLTPLHYLGQDNNNNSNSR